ncbi:hypothetical protein D1007_13583 [Hordeum vulgare]|nr:hypothetical protein D1007_13583 [Hordeum vulgare]
MLQRTKPLPPGLAAEAALSRLSMEYPLAALYTHKTTPFRFLHHPRLPPKLILTCSALFSLRHALRHQPLLRILLAKITSFTSIRWALSRLGDVCSVDQYCVDGRDYTAVRALIMVNCNIPLPDSLTTQLPPTNDLKVVKISKLATVLDQMGPSDPSPFESDSDSDNIPASCAQPFCAHPGADEELPQGPLSSPVCFRVHAQPNGVVGMVNMPILVSSGDEAAANQGPPILSVSSDNDSAPLSQRAPPPSEFSVTAIVDSSNTTSHSINRPTPCLAAIVGGYPPASSPGA